jgi:hypothetical protein
MDEGITISSEAKSWEIQLAGSLDREPLTFEVK